MRNLFPLLLLFSPALVTAQQTSAQIPDAVAKYEVTLHEQLSSSCEVIQAATLVQHKQYDALLLANTTDEIYSPELAKSDFVAISDAVPKQVVKSAKKSGFRVRLENPASTPGGKPETKGNSCPDLQRAISEASRQRYQRRMELQTQFHTLGSNLLPPTAIKQVQPESAVNQSAAQSSATSNKKQGTVVVAIAIGVDGNVHGVKVVRELDATLDQKAMDAVRQWQFSPARMNGLPVPVEVMVEVNFRLH